MLHSFLKSFFLFLAVFSGAAYAATLNKQDVPGNVFDYVYKKHPEAKDFNIEEKIHFGLSLYKVSFTANQKNKNGQDFQAKFVDLFKMDGHFYTNEIVVEKHSYNVVSDEVTKKLKLRYPDYEIMAMKAVSNPNNVGEEYEIDLLTSGKLWDIAIDNQGNLISETQQ